LPFEDFILVA